MTTYASLYGAHSCKRPGVDRTIADALANQPSATKATYPDSALLPFMRRSAGDAFQFAPAPFSTHDSSALVLLHGAGLIVYESEDKTLSLPVGLRPDWVPADLSGTGFGWYHARPVQVFTLPKEVTPPAPYRIEPFNAFQENLSPELMSIAGLGKQVAAWQAASTVCSRCGGSPQFGDKNWGRRCDRCGHEHFPSIHPCAIVLITRGRDLLLIRKPEWPQNRFSLVAGFLDMGESFEECAAREALEETGVTIGNIRYVTSQPWPFPSQVMIGFVAEYLGGEIRIQADEIAEARWFSPEELPNLPSTRSIARYLIDTYGRTRE